MNQNMIASVKKMLKGSPVKVSEVKAELKVKTKVEDFAEELKDAGFTVEKQGRVWMVTGVSASVAYMEPEVDTASADAQPEMNEVKKMIVSVVRKPLAFTSGGEVADRLIERGMGHDAAWDAVRAAIAELKAEGVITFGGNPAGEFSDAASYKLISTWDYETIALAFLKAQPNEQIDLDVLHRLAMHYKRVKGVKGCEIEDTIRGIGSALMTLEKRGTITIIDDEKAKARNIFTYIDIRKQLEELEALYSVPETTPATPAGGTEQAEPEPWPVPTLTKYESDVAASLKVIVQKLILDGCKDVEKAIDDALSNFPLDPEARKKVLDYVMHTANFEFSQEPKPPSPGPKDEATEKAIKEVLNTLESAARDGQTVSEDILDGIMAATIPDKEKRGFVLIDLILDGDIRLEWRDNRP